MIQLTTLPIVYPEIFLLLMTSVVALVGVNASESRLNLTFWIAEISLGILALMHLNLLQSGATVYGMQRMVVADPLGHLLALSVTPADQGDRAQVEALAHDMQQVTGGTVEMAYVDQGYTGPNAAEAAQSHGIRLEVVKHPMAKRGFVLLPRRWVVERSFAWAARFRRLVRNYERLDTTLKGFHYVAFACLMIANMFKQLA